MNSKKLLSIFIFVVLFAFARTSWAQSTIGTTDLRSIKQRERDRMRRTKEDVSWAVDQPQLTREAVPLNTTTSYYKDQSHVGGTEGAQTQIDPRLKEYLANERYRMERALGNIYSNNTENDGESGSSTAGRSQQGLPVVPKEFIQRLWKSTEEKKQDAPE